MGLAMESPAFSHNNFIPMRYTCDSVNNPPPLKWEDDSTKTQSYVLIVDDTDPIEGTWVHWVLFNIPVETKLLTESSVLPPGAISGKNSWGLTGYGGPCPPARSHRYSFRLYALDTTLNLDATANKDDVERAMSNHIIASAELVGFYRRKGR